MELKLNIKKIEAEMVRQGVDRKWLVKQTGTSRQLIDYWFSSATVKAAGRMADALGYSDPKDLVV